METYLKETLGEEYGARLIARVNVAVPEMKQELPEYDLSDGVI